MKKDYPPNTLKKSLPILVLLFSFSLAYLFAAAKMPAARAQAAGQFFEAEPLAKEQSKGRNLLSCLSGWRQFISAGIGTQGFKDYWRDFSLYPAHYADVVIVEQQLNKARYAVMAAFLRCDLNKLKSVTNAYYKLEAELYFVRHFVETSGGSVKILTENPAERQKLVDEVANHIILFKKSQNPEEDRAIISGYFSTFETKYKERAKKYAQFGNDAVYGELGKKFDELIDTFKSFGKINNDLQKEEKPAEKTAEQNRETKTPAHAGALKNIKELAAAIAKRFDACATTEDKRYCITGEDRKKTEDPFTPSNITKSSEKKTFGEVMFLVEKRAQERTEDIDKVQMLAKYEILYGQVNGDGIIELMKKMDALLAILGPAKEEGSIEPLNKLQQCAKHVNTNQCK